MTKFVTYLRVSTERQGQSGLGLEAQRAAVLDHVAGKGEIAAGGASLRQIADELNTRGIKTARGGLWYAGTVRNIMARENEIEAKEQAA